MVIAFPSSAITASKYAVTLSPFLPKPGQSATQVTSPIQRPSFSLQYSLNSCRVAFLGKSGRDRGKQENSENQGQP